MAGVKVKMNRAGMAALLKSAGVRHELTARGEKVLAKAQATAPVASGEYRDSLQITQATTDRAVVRIGSTAAHAWFVEARTGNLARALDAGR